MSNNSVLEYPLTSSQLNRVPQSAEFGTVYPDTTNLRIEHLHYMMFEAILEMAIVYASLATVVIAVFTMGIFITHAVQTKHIHKDLKDRNNLKFYNIISDYIIEDKKLHLKQKNALVDASSEYVERDTEEDFHYRLDQAITPHLRDRLDELEEFSRTVRFVGVDLKMVKKIVYNRTDTLYGKDSHPICQSFLKHPENKERFENLHWLKKELNKID